MVQGRIGNRGIGRQTPQRTIRNPLDAIAARPNACIPAAAGGRNELEAAYRFFDNENVTPQKILKPHYNTTTLRCRTQKVVLCAQDTTELDFTRDLPSRRRKSSSDGVIMASVCI